MFLTASSPYARAALESARLVVQDVRAPPSDRAHASFTMRFYSGSADLAGPLTTPATESPIDLALRSLDDAIADAPDCATKVVLAQWLVEVAR